ncbi:MULTISPECIES: hypothetical protein [unclassified Isoptericola]|uniref:FitA-like ribbon-helix-helix domain-containing protein n=1 Tax=unclassified Isoptericola TaxID=2623355 RepID=UPI0027137B82|nr:MULTISPECIES: hypothetical protein [unclassified Isoptericola]MDO8148809.1 hypothetical protein [Isoptericola sp. b515]MDO8151250.1 hypothetical protein [Isoptericola sp. b408]
MSTLQVRDVPDDVKRVLKARAARSGQSLSEFVLQELSELAGRPTISELTDRIRDRGSYTPGVAAADVLAAARSERE